MPNSFITSACLYVCCVYMSLHACRSIRPYVCLFVFLNASACVGKHHHVWSDETPQPNSLVCLLSEQFPKSPSQRLSWQVRYHVSRESLQWMTALSRPSPIVRAQAFAGRRTSGHPTAAPTHKHTHTRNHSDDQNSSNGTVIAYVSIERIPSGFIDDH